MLKGSRLSKNKQERLIELFISGCTGRTAGELVGINKNTSCYYFERLRELIYKNINICAEIITS